MLLLIELTYVRVLQVDAVSFVLYKNPESLSALISNSLSKLELKELLCPHISPSSTSLLLCTEHSLIKRQSPIKRMQKPNTGNVFFPFAQ